MPAKKHFVILGLVAVLFGLGCVIHFLLMRTPDAPLCPIRLGLGVGGVLGGVLCLIVAALLPPIEQKNNHEGR